jgi:hypothetical protein
MLICLLSFVKDMAPAPCATADACLLLVFTMTQCRALFILLPSSLNCEQLESMEHMLWVFYFTLCFLVFVVSPALRTEPGTHCLPFRCLLDAGIGGCVGTLWMMHFLPPALPGFGERCFSPSGMETGHCYGLQLIRTCLCEWSGPSCGKRWTKEAGTEKDKLRL